MFAMSVASIIQRKNDQMQERIALISIFLGAGKHKKVQHHRCLTKRL